MNRIYLDHASTTYMLPEVVEGMHQLMLHQYGNPSSIHHHGRVARSVIEQARKTIAKAIKASVGEIIFTSSATEANNTILRRSILDLHVRRIITVKTEHHCILHTCEDLERQYQDLSVTYLDVDHLGHIDYLHLEELLKTAVNGQTLVSIMHGNNEIGTLHNVQLISELCRKYQVLFHCDAVQSIGKLQWDVQNTPLAFLSGSGHKFNGPKGVGFFYMNNDNIIHPWITGGAQERSMRSGTENIYGIHGMGIALAQKLVHMESDHSTLLALKKYFRKQLQEKLWDIQFNGDQDDTRSLAHVLSVSFPDTPRADMLMFNLDINGISASSGSACSAGIEMDSHVLLAIGHDTRRKTIRFSLSPSTTMEEIDHCLNILGTLTPLQ